MKASRLFLYSLAALALTLLAAGIYLYPRLPALLEQQARTYLSAYGIDEVELGSLQFSRERLATDQLRLAGDMDGLQFDVTVSGISVDYTPGELWRGHIGSVMVAGLEASVAEQAMAPVSEAFSIALSEVHPARLLAGLPVAALEVKQWQLDYRPLQGDVLAAQGSLQWHGQLSLPFAAGMSGGRVAGKLTADERDSLGLEAALYAEAGVNAGGDALVHMQATAEQGGTDRWQWRMAGGVDYLPLLDWLRDLQLEGVSQALENLMLVGTSEFKLELDHPDDILLSTEAAQDLPGQLDGSVQALTTVSSFSHAGTVQEASGQFEVMARLAGGTVEATLGPVEMDGHIPVALLQLPEETRQWLRWDDSLPLRWRETGAIRLAQTGDSVWRLQMEDNRLLLGDKNSQVKFDGMALDVTLDMSQGQNTVLALDTKLDIRLRQKQLPQLQLALKQSGSIQDSDFELRVGDTAQSLALSLDGEVNAQTGQGSFVAGLRSLDLPYAGSAIVPLLQKFDLLQQPLAFSGGSISLDSELHSGGFSLEKLAQKANLSIEGVSGSYGEYQFEDIDVSASWQGVEKWQTLQPATLSIARLDVGFDVTDTRASLVLPRPTALDSPVFRVEQFESALFGGRVYLPEPARWDFSRASNSVTLRADDWRLENIVALQTGQDIQADGTLEGELPVTVSGGRIIVEKGYLRARAPGGSIRYIANAASQALAASSSELGLAMGLLEDFRYRTLSSEVELDPEGNLLLALSLEGSNPAQYEGRRIRFNINLEQNLDPLLQSLRLSDSLVEKVEKGLR